jgi:hypothetical protein
VAVQIRLAAIVLIAGLLAACTSGDAQPTPSTSSIGTVSTAQTSPSPTQTGPLTTGPNVRPGEKPPELAPIGREHNDAGATVVGAYYFKALDWTIATNDDWLLAHLALPSCEACARVHAGLLALRAKGETELGGRILVRAAVVDRASYKIKYDVAVRVTYDEEAVRLRLVGGSTRRTQPAVHGETDVVFLRWRGDRWRIAEVAES